MIWLGCGTLVECQPRPGGIVVWEGSFPPWAAAAAAWGAKCCDIHTSLDIQLRDLVKGIRIPPGGETQRLHLKYECR
eukprot:scaffold7642_cov54-Attheya_sp.AAC.2